MAEGGKKKAGGRNYFALQSQICTYTFQSRRDSVKLCRLRLGHCGLIHFLFIVGKHVSGLCECGSSETVKHIFWSVENIGKKDMYCLIDC